jgi:hypothetical protein
MSMKHIFGFGLLVMTVAAGAAQAEVQAKFHLPFGARWGEMTLAPGDYVMQLPEASLGVRQFTVTGDHKTGYVQPVVTDYHDALTNDSDRSYLQLVKVNGTYFVTKYRSGATGKLFSFAVPTHKHKKGTTEEEVVKLGFSSN